MEGLVNLDSWILSGFEKFSHRWQKLTGLACFWLARISLVLAILSFSVMFSILAISRGSDIVLLSMLGPVCVLLINLMWWEITKIERITTEYAGNGYSNPYKTSNWTFRVACLFNFLILQANSLFTNTGLLLWIGFPSYSFFIACAAYFTACDPLPPAKSKIRQWLEAGAERIKKSFAPNVGEPIPNPS